MKLPFWLSRLVDPRGAREQSSAEEIESLRADFRSRYHSFKLLLTANNRALEIMTEIEDALGGGRPFGMNFVRSRCTRVAASVFQIVKNLNEISHGKYGSLFERFGGIQQEISGHLSFGRRDEDSPLVVSLDRLDRRATEQVGGKMANLGELRSRIGVNAPRGFAVTTKAFWLFMEHESLQKEIDKTIQTMESEGYDHLYELSEVVQVLVLSASVPPALEEAITESYSELERSLGRDVSVAVRSSSPLEDLPGMSMAGQYHTELGVTRGEILEAYKKVVASKYSYQAMMSRLNAGVRDDDVPMCVGVMPMVEAVAGGVVYTRNPVDFDDGNLMIYSAFGLPKSVVDGTAAADHLALSREEPIRIVSKEIVRKEQMLVCASDEKGYRSEPTGDLAGEASLSEEKAIELGRLALKIEELYGVVQDIEWALDSQGSITVLQSRPLLPRRERPEERRVLAEPGGAEAVVLEGGVTASPGCSGGPVVVVKRERDVLGFPDGAVLVADQALPYWAVLLGRASAIVAERGSVAGHLASVAREQGVPALFGVKGATARLANGGAVTVDADAKRIYRGRIEEMERRPIPIASRIQGSGVYESLRKASEHIVPLNLLDPESPTFRPSKCKTLHDITRFCHEKSVKEMFKFGIEHRFPERSSKQLFVDVPMQFWIIDLDDGFSQSAPIEDRFIRLGHIDSIPMLALWRGITAVPWEGPPPVDTKGFLSVLVESTANPKLVSSVSSDYADRNYFMISRNFVSLQSRFGYHFSTVEALVGDRDSENYLNFLFKGGAANLERRVLRARLVAEILEEKGFRTKVVQDSVSARMEGYGREVMEPCLEVVGYLTIHTRQLDMVMTNESSLKTHRAKIIEDLKSLSPIG